jgi:hypothetical protein
MIPAWMRPILFRGTVAASVCVVVLGGVWLASQSWGQEADPIAQNQAPGDSAKKPSVADPDRGKLPKELTNARQTHADGPKDTLPRETMGPPEAKLITLSAAIQMVELAGKGEVTKAEKVGDGDSAQFNVEVLAQNGTRKTLQVSATGRVILETTLPPKKGIGKKGKGG